MKKSILYLSCLLFAVFGIALIVKYVKTPNIPAQPRTYGKNEVRYYPDFTISNNVATSEHGLQFDISSPECKAKNSDKTAAEMVWADFMDKIARVYLETYFRNPVTITGHSLYFKGDSVYLSVDFVKGMSQPFDTKKKIYAADFVLKHSGEVISVKNGMMTIVDVNMISGGRSKEWIRNVSRSRFSEMSVRSISDTITIQCSINEFGQVLQCKEINSKSNNTQLVNDIIAEIYKWSLGQIDKPGDTTVFTLHFH